LATDYTTVDTSLQSIGMTFNSVGLASLAARENLVAVSGGLDQLASQAQFFQQNFLTDADAIAPIATALKAEMKSLGYSSIATKAQFVALVKSIDVTTAAGADLYAQLMAIAPAFAKVADYNKQAIADATGSQIDIINGIASATQNLQQQYQGFVESIKSYRQSLLVANDNGLSYQALTARTRSIFQGTAAGAANNNLASFGSLQNDSQNYLAALKNSAHTAQEYQLGVAEVAQALDAAQTTAQGQVDVAQQTLDTATSQLTTLNAIAGNTQTTSDNIKSLADAQAALAYAIANPVQPRTANDNYVSSTPTVGTGGPAGDAGNGGGAAASYTSTQGDAVAYVEGNPDILAAYNDYGKKQGTAEAAFGNWQWATFGKDENRPVRLFAKGGMFTNGIVSNPTDFDIGRMGEKEPEGVLPLVNTPKGLGVRSVGGGGDPALANQLERLRQEQQAGMIAIATYTQIVAKLAERWENNGLPVRNPDPTQPIPVRQTA
jgi:hypothetical protein